MALYAFEGTWKDAEADDPATPELETDRNTNVVRVLQAYKCPNSFYIDGIGTDAGPIGRAVGGAFGVGGRKRVARAMGHLRSRLAAGDAGVDIVGFSRGAAQALAFANRIAKWSRGSRGRPVPIRFLGLFDVVGAFGIPFNLGPLRFQEYNLGYALELPANVEYCFHAMALDERRQTFQLTRVAGAYEVWFRGAHSDVGGGNGNIGLNAIALSWMLRKAAACGLPVQPEAVEAARAKHQPDAAILWPDPDPIKNAFRTVEPEDRVHHTVARPRPSPQCNDVPPGCPEETQAHEGVAIKSSAYDPQG